MNSMPTTNHDEVIEVEVVVLEPIELPAINGYAKGYLKLFEAEAQEVRLAAEAMAAMQVTDDDSRRQLFELAKAANKVEKLIDARRLKALEPVRELLALVNGQVKEKLSTPLEAAVKSAKDKISAYDASQEAKRKEEARLLAEHQAEVERQAKAKEAEIASQADAEAQRLKTEAYAARQAEINAMPRGIARVQAQRALDAEIAGKVVQVQAAADAALGEARIDLSVARATTMNKVEDLEAQKPKGASTRWVASERPEDIEFDKVDDRFKVMNWPAVRKAIADGARAIRGLKVYEERTVALR